MRVFETLELETVLQRVIDNARWLTGARYGALLSFDASGEIADIVTSGASEGEFHGVANPPEGKGLLGYLNEVDGPLLVADVSRHPKAVGLPDGHPPMHSFLGMKIHREGQHIGNIYLAERDHGGEFDQDDADIISQFAANAGAAISNARKFESAQRVKTHLQALVDISPVGVVVFDARTGAVISANRECQRICDDLHLPGGSWERMPELVKFRRADGRELSFSELPSTRVMQSGEIIRAEEIVICLPNGRSVTTLVNAAPIYSDRGDIVSVVVTIQDMTPRLDEERMRTEFLGMVSQEMRTPLSAIKGSIVALTDLARSMPSTEPLQLLQIIDHQADLMRAQINSLIDLSDIDAGTLQLTLNAVNVTRLVEGAINEFGRHHAGQTVQANISTGLPDVVADSRRLDQVLRDLFAYSFKYSTVAATITVSAGLQDSEVAVSVSTVTDCDHNAEPPQLLDRLRAARLGDDHDIAEVGGLALSIARGVVYAHGGRFTVDRSPDEHGVTFTLTLPVVDTAGDNESSPASAAVAGDLPLAGEKPPILVVAEDPHVLSTMRRTLSRANFTPLAVFDADELEPLVEDQRPEIAVIDLAAPGQKGFELLEWLVTEHRTSVIGIIDPDDETSAILAFDKGAEGYIVKPFSPTELVARIRALIRRKSNSSLTGANEGFSLGNISIDYGSHRVTVAGQPVQLTAT